MLTRIALAMIEWGGPGQLLAEHCGIQPSHLSEYTLGRRPIPPSTVLKLATALRVTPDRIVGVCDANDPYIEWDVLTLDVWNKPFDAYIPSVDGEYDPGYDDWGNG